MPKGYPNPQRPKSGRRFHCRLCKYTTSQLGKLRSHHSKAHPTEAAKRGEYTKRTISTLPTTPRRSTHHTKSQHAVNYCPSCGFHIGGLPT